MSDQTIQVKYVGTVQRWPELAITGRQSTWAPGQIESRAPSEATALLATGLFSSPPVPVTAVTSPGGGVTLSSEASAAIENSYPVKNAATQTTPQAWERLQIASGAVAAGISVRVNGNRYEFSGVIYGTFTIDTIIAKLFSGYEEAVDSTAVCASSVGPVSVTVTRQNELVVTGITGTATWIDVSPLSAEIRRPNYQRSLAITPSLPIVRINTGGADLPAPALDTYIAATISVDPNGHDVPALAETAFSISGHGNSTWTYPKKSMKLKFSTPVGLLGMPAEKSFRALANYVDRTNIRNSVCFEMARRLSPHWTPRDVYCEVFLNGVYQGLYEMTEPVKSGVSRLDINTPKASSSAAPELGAYMIEISERMETDGAIGFRTPLQNVPIQFEEPDNPNAAQLAYVQAKFTAFEAALYSVDWLDPTNGYAKYVDFTSWADWFCVTELSKQADAMFSSSKLWLGEGENGKIFFGPLWDSDRSFGGWSIPLAGYVDFSTPPSGWKVSSAKFWIRLISDPAFFAVVKARWAILKNEVERPGGIVDWAKQLAMHTATAAGNNAMRWGFTDDAKARLDLVLGFLRSRVDWIDARLTMPVVRNIVKMPKPATDGSSALTGAGLWFITGGGTAVLSSGADNPLGGRTLRCTWTVSPTGARAGPYMTNLPCEEGKTYTMAAWVRSSKKQRVIFDAEQKPASGVTVGALTTSAGDIEIPANRLIALPPLVFTLGAGMTMVQATLFNATGSPWVAGDWYEICGLLLVEGSFPRIGFASPDDNPTWVWDGVPFNSTSTGPAP
jgi:hypothetical protein